MVDGTHLICLMLAMNQPNGDHLRQSHLPRSTAASIPINCATINAGTPVGSIPAKVSDSDLANVTAGFAKDVDAVNQYVAVM